MNTSALKSIKLRNYRGIGSKGGKLSFDHQFLAIIGVNNSGKTVILKSIFELREIFVRLSSTVVNITQYFTAGMTSEGVRLYPGETIYPKYQLSAYPRIVVEVNTDDEDGSSLKELEIVIKRDGSIKLAMTMSDGTVLNDALEIGAINIENKVLIKVTRSNGKIILIDWEPMREAMSTLANSMYVGAFRNFINAGGTTYYDLTVGTEFISQYDNYKNGDVPIYNEAIETMNHELASIFGYQSMQVNVATNKRELIFMINGISYRSTELGAGISQFVLVVANVLVKRPQLLLIDEPELNLHASLQMRFLTLLATYTQKSVIFSTHSLGLARSVADKIIVTRSEGEGQGFSEEYHASNNLAASLGQMGYGGLNDSAYKAILLVEGVKDIRVMQQLLSKKGVRNEVAVLSLGGDDLAAGRNEGALTELTKLSESIYAIVDSEQQTPEGSPSARRLEFKRKCDELSIECLVLKRRAIENYMDLEIARRIMQTPQASDFGHYEKTGADWNWSKELNWQIAKDMRIDALEDTDLDKFLEQIATYAVAA